MLSQYENNVFFASLIRSLIRLHKLFLSVTLSDILKLILSKNCNKSLVLMTKHVSPYANRNNYIL